MKRLAVLAMGFLAWGCGSDDGGGTSEANGSSDSDAVTSDAVTSSDSGQPNGALDGPAAAWVEALSFVPSNVANFDFESDSEGAAWDPEGMVFSGSACTGETRINTDDCSVACLSRDAYSCRVVVQSDGSEVAVFRTSRIVIPANVSIRPLGARPLVLVATGDVVIDGRIIAYDPVYEEDGVLGGFSGVEDADGLGPGGGQASPVTTSLGGGGGAFCGKGGTGGVPSSPQYSAAQGGRPYGNPEIVPLQGGSAGGAAGNYQEGAAGGGAIQVVSATSIRIGATGIISVPGQGGRGIGAGGGGGAGGAILLEAPEVSVAGVLAANGGGGGKKNAVGLMGTEDDQPAKGGLSETVTGWVGGGAGGAGTQVDGGDATSSDGAGGGGAGWIRINTRTGEADITGIISPSLESPCASIGVLGAGGGDTGNSGGEPSTI